MTMRKLIEDNDSFTYYLGFWDHQGMALSGFKVVKITTADGFEYEPVVFDFHDPEIGYVKTTGPYKTWRGAFSVIGATYDKIDKEYQEKWGNTESQATQ
jgi:hypothetical protein